MAEKAEVLVITTFGTTLPESASLHLIVYREMTPLVGSGSAQVAMRLLEDPGTVESMKFVGAEGTVFTNNKQANNIS